MATELQVYGINETLRYLKEYEKDLYSSLRKDLVSKATPLAKLAGSRFPDEPLQNWHTSGGRLTSASRLPPYMGGKAQSGVRPVAGTGSSRGKGQVILRIQQKDAGAQVYDSAGSQTKGARGAGATQGQKFIANLDKNKRLQSFGGGKTRSRILFGAVQANEKMIEQDVVEVINKVDAYFTKAINSGIGR